MRIIADFHIHSKYSRAVSPKMNLEEIGKFGVIKGIDVIGTGDFTHPLWFSELKSKLILDKSNFYSLKGIDNSSKFVFTGEVSLIYKKFNKTRKIHLILISPNLETTEKINKKLSEKYNLSSDGRPILKLDAKEFLKIILNISKEVLVIPAHIMTPFFGLYGSKSGFDSIKDCFEELEEYIYAYETGLSANPEMLLKMEECRKRALISNSDAHSLDKLGREANVFETNFNYESIIKKIKEKDFETIEFFPEEGKYFNDGHRNCEISLSPEETYTYGGVCPVCGKPLTIGVSSRIKKLSDLKESEGLPFKSLVPLKEIIGEVSKVGILSKKVEEEYQKLIQEFKSEFNILLYEDISKIKKVNQSVALAIEKVRLGDLLIIPGYDGEFGKVKIYGEKVKKIIPQKTLL